MLFHWLLIKFDPKPYKPFGAALALAKSRLGAFLPAKMFAQWQPLYGAIVTYTVPVGFVISLQ